MLKKIALLFSFIAFGFFIYTRGHQEEKPTQVKTGWEKYQKVKKKVSSTPAKKEDLEKHLLPVTSRKPASKAPSKRPMRSGRYLEGQNSRKFINPTESLKFKNKVDSNWKKNLGHNLTRFQPEGTEVLIKKERGLIFLKKNLGEYREQVLISYKLPNGKKSSYRAMIDSESGKIIYTYDRTINENYRKKPAGLSHPLAQ